MQQPDQPSVEPPTVPEVGAGPVVKPAAPRLWPYALAAGLIAGTLSWLAGEAVHGQFKLQRVVPANWKDLNPYQKADHYSREERLKEPLVVAKNTALTYGILGALLGGALGLAGGLARGSTRDGLWAGAIGLIATGAVAAGACALAAPEFRRYVDLNPDAGVMPPMLTHAVIFALAGATAGLAFGWGLRGRLTMLRSFVGGLIGALIGTVIFEVIIAMAYPLMRRLEPVPSEWFPRLLVHLCVALATAAIIVVSLQSQRAPRTDPAPALD
jgi:hypothetical protein